MLISKDSEALLSILFQIAEANNVTTVLYGIQYSVRTTICLQQAVQLQVLIYPKRVQRLGIESSEEHAHHNQDVHILILHALRHILIVALEAVAIR